MRGQIIILSTFLAFAAASIVDLAKDVEGGKGTGLLKDVFGGRGGKAPARKEHQASGKGAVVSTDVTKDLKKGQRPHPPPQQKPFWLSQQQGRFLEGYVAESIRMSSGLSKVEPCFLGTQDVQIGNETAVLKDPRLFGLHDYHLLMLHLAPAGRNFRMTFHLGFRVLRSIANVSMESLQLNSKTLLSNHYVRLDLQALLNVSDLLSVEKMVGRASFGPTIIDILSERPVKEPIMVAIAKAYLPLVTKCVHNVIPEIQHSINVIMGGVPVGRVLEKPVRPINKTPKEQMQRVQKIMKYLGERLPQIKLDPLPVPIEVSPRFNVSGVIEGLSKPIVTYAGVDARDSKLMDLLVHYPVLPTRLNAAFPTGGMKIRTLVRDLYLQLQVTNNDHPQVVDATDISVKVPRPKSRDYKLRYILRKMKMFFASNLDRYIVNAFSKPN